MKIFKYIANFFARKNNEAAYQRYLETEYGYETLEKDPLRNYPIVIMGKNGVRF